MSNKDFQVSDIGEKGLIKRIIEKTENFDDYNKTFNGVSYIGDDAALLDINKNLTNEDSYLIATSDLLLEKYHFPKEMSYFQMGWKSVTVNISDLAAMGSTPSGILISLAIPSNLKLKFFDEIIDGILSACSHYKIPLIGGDTNQAEEIIISGSAFGTVEKEKVMKKNGFACGDLIAITAEVGLAALGFEILKEENSKLIKDGVKNGKINQKILDLPIQKVLNPLAKLNEGIILKNFATSATDITDGLASELYELFNADKQQDKDSKLGLMIYEDKIKNEGIFKEIYKVSKLIDKDPLDLILHIGEDFELLFTFNNKATKDYIKDNNKDNDIINNNFIVIGEVNNSNKVEITLSNGTIKELSSKGYEHLS